MSTSVNKTISFAEIVQGRDASVRITDDGLIYVLDLVMVVTGSSRDDAGKTLRRLSDDIFHSDKLSERQLSDRGGRPTKLIGFQDAIELIMVLPGKLAKETRAQFAEIIRRYLGGDRSLLVEIEANAESTSPIAELARATLVEDPEERRKRLREDDLRLNRLEQEVQEKKMKNMQTWMSLMNTIRPDWMESDARFRLQTEDWIKNIMSDGSAPLQITDGTSPEARPASLSISQLVKELGGRPLTHGQNCSIGRLAAKRYKQLHSVDPPKHRQWVDGVERDVNSYTEDDRELLTDALLEIGFVPDL